MSSTVEKYFTSECSERVKYFFNKILKFEQPNHFTLIVVGVKGAIYYEAIATVIFSHVKISSFRAKAHLVFH